MSFISRRHKTWGESYIKSTSSAKKFSERIERTRNYVKEDSSHKIVYQICSEGKIVKIWDSVSQISEHFKTYNAKVRESIKQQKIVSGCLFVPMLEYKSTINYKILIKLLNNKLTKL